MDSREAKVRNLRHEAKGVPLAAETHEHVRLRACTTKKDATRQPVISGRTAKATAAEPAAAHAAEEAGRSGADRFQVSVDDWAGVRADACGVEMSHALRHRTNRRHNRRQTSTRPHASSNTCGAMRQVQLPKCNFLQL